MDLYAENILDHYRSPHNAGQIKNPSVQIREHNPLCGDVITLELSLDSKGIIRDIGFVGNGCAISQAAMSLLSDEVKRKGKTAIKKMSPQKVTELLGVEISPARMKCALLGFTALQKAIRMDKESKK